ncbi:hypothetical protein EVAR_94454_1 [Eumeta japonica]|uniref:Uncharacterized protein n=1 Tax=Eumeta variegata TaxID=151549 RepID=A0A4C1ZSP8_EUMVA|nr:hypothetical protein EVAR_94454_1 [Eumeta japonica]
MGLLCWRKAVVLPAADQSWNGDTRARRAAPRPVPCITVRPHRRIIIVVPTSLAHKHAVAAALDVYSFCSDTAMYTRRRPCGLSFGVVVTELEELTRHACAAAWAGARRLRSH